jgi:signal transduction histidine kinase
MFVATLGTRLWPVCSVLLFWIAGTLAASSETRHIILLYDERVDLPGLAVLDAKFVRTLRSGSPEPVEVYREAMDLSRFDSQAHLLLFREYLRAKYAGKRIDAAVAVMGPSLDFMLKHGEVVFPGAPIIFCGIDRRELADRPLPPRVTGVLLKRDFSPTLDLALSLHPDASLIVVVSGTSEFDTRILEDARGEFQAYEGRLAFKYLTALPLRELLTELSQLPPRTIVLFTTLFRDGAGEPFVPHEVVERISAAANAPVYGFVDQFLGHGIVGGSLYSLEAHGEMAARLTLRVVASTDPVTPPLIEPGASTILFDWRQLRRWGIGEHRWPSGGDIRFRPSTAWEQYRWQIVLVVLALLGQSLLIVGLIYQRRRRHLAEAEAQQRMAELAHMNRRATAGEMSASIAHEINQPLAAITSSGNAGMRWLTNVTPNVEKAIAAFKRIVADGHRASQVVETVRVMFKKDAQQRVQLDMNEVLGEVLGFVRLEFDRHDVSVRRVLTEGLPAVLADRVQLQQVVLNLVRNSIEAMNSTSDRPRVLEVKSEANAAGEVIMSIKDTGPGIDPSDAGRIFEPFFTTKPSGMGMGLSICRTIVESHGGRLFAAPGKPYGSVFQIVLPRDR